MPKHNLTWLACYEDARGLKKDLKKAFKYYTLAADQGYAKAQFNLAICYEDGTGL